MCDTRCTLVDSTFVASSAWNEGKPPWLVNEGKPPWLVNEGKPPWLVNEGKTPWLVNKNRNVIGVQSNIL
jgi:hypothetical protein